MSDAHHGTSSDPRPPTRIWDAIVVGAGPAGATAARVAAAAGREVLLLERATIPRYKTCGGGLIGASLAALPSGLALNVLDTAGRFTFSYDGRAERTLASRFPTCAMVFRSELDAALTEAAAAAGATVRDGTALAAVVSDERGVVTVRTHRGEALRARALVGADGSASRTARHVGVRCAQVDIALEVETPVDDRTAERWRGRLLLEWGPLPGSFGWVFPKDGICTAGVVASRGTPTGTLRAYRETFLRRHGLLDTRPLHDTGHLTRCRTPDSPLSRGRVLVAGDAAGLLDHWSREGISYALRSGAVAGEAAARLSGASGPAEVMAATDAYRSRIEDIMGADMTASARLMGLFARHPAVVHTALTRLPPLWRHLDAYVAGHSSVDRIMRTPLARSATTVGALLPGRRRPAPPGPRQPG